MAQDRVPPITGSPASVDEALEFVAGLAASGSGGSGTDWIEVNLGTGAPGPYVVTHNKNTRSVRAFVYRNGLPGDDIDVLIRRPSVNAIVFDPDETWAQDQYRAVLEFYVGKSDVIPPSKPTVSVSEITANSAKVTAVSIDENGVKYYNFFLNNQYVASSANGSYIFADLAGNTDYTTKVTAVDAAGNESLYSDSTPFKTLVVPKVDYLASAANKSTGSNVSVTQAVPSTPDCALVVAVLDSHSSWQTGESVGMAINDSSGDVLTPVSLLNIGVAGQEQGTLRTYIKLNPKAGDHVITATPGTLGTQVIVESGVYSGVGSYSDVTTGQYISPDGVVTNSLSAFFNSAKNDRIVVAFAMSGSAAPTTDKNDRVGIGADVGGWGDFLTLSDALAPDGNSTTVTTTNKSIVVAGSGLRLVKK